MAVGPALGQVPEALEQYRAGVAALDAHRYDEAREALLDAVAIDPGFAGAWLDLALATAGAGDLAQAEEFLDILEARFTLPAPLAEAVAGLRLRLGSALATPEQIPAWRWNASAQAGVGYDTNANAGVALDSLTLTLPGGLLQLPLARSLQPRGDGYALAGVAVAGWRPLGADRLDVGFSARGRRNFEEGDFDTLDLRARAAWTVGPWLDEESVGRRGDGPWRFSAALQHVRLGGETLANSIDFAADRVWPALPCRPSAGAEVDFRTYPVARTLDASVLWLGATARCPGLQGAQDRSSLGLEARVGHAFARHGEGSGLARPGGDTRHLEIGASHEWYWSAPHGLRTLQAQVVWERAADTDGYSPLLRDNRRRNVTRSVAGIGYSIPLAPIAGNPVELLFGVQWYRQRSNLELFRLSGEIYQLSLRARW
ncbi:MAG TPA: tetratricopeptide repeat protein [Zeimonas sp.]